MVEHHSTCGVDLIMGSKVRWIPLEQSRLAWAELHIAAISLTCKFPNADTKAAEDFSEKIVAREFTRNFSQGILHLEHLLGH